MKIASLLSLVAVAATSIGAEAAIYDFGQVGTMPVVRFVQVLPGAVSDRFDFTLGSLSDAAASATDHPLYFGSFAVLDIPNLSMSIFASSGGVVSAPAASGVSITNTNMVAGSYYAVVTGNTTGMFGGAYSIAMTAQALPAGPTSQPVPVPLSLWLLGSGLLGVAGVMRRRHAS